MMNKSDFDSYYEYLQQLISKTSPNGRVNMHDLVSDLLKSRLTKLPERENKDCKVEYKHNNLEFIVWNVALLSASWTLENFKRKLEDGHCHNTGHAHGIQTPRNCSIGRKFHIQMYHECLTSFKNLISNADPPLSNSNKRSSSN
ncbi:MAG TPA: hypothetical protein VH500_06515 [Nitrososphaeraceae archaeon]|jgi:hypothetical protein